MIVRLRRTPAARRSATTVAAVLAGFAPAAADGPLSVTFLHSVPLHDDELGFTEPSGLALDPSDGSFWSVSDDTEGAFRLSPEGEPSRAEGLLLPVRGLEGVAVDGDRLIFVREEGNEILLTRRGDDAPARRIPLSDLVGWEDVAEAFEGHPNKGLEGVAVDAATGVVFVLKEGRPRMMLALSPELDRILDHRRLDAAAGFVSEHADDRDLDVSGLAHDPERRLFWIVSDRGRRLYLYDWDARRATSAPLLATIDGKEETIRAAEGIALVPGEGRLHVVSDDGRRSRLYVYRIR